MESESLLSPTMLDYIGKESPPGILPVDADLLRRLHQVISPEPGGQPGEQAPAWLPLVLEWAAPQVSVPGLPEHSLITGDAWSWQGTAHLGDTLTVVCRLAGLRERYSPKLGAALLLDHEWQCANTAGEPVAALRRTLTYYLGEASRLRPPKTADGTADGPEQQHQHAHRYDLPAGGPAAADAAAAQTGDTLPALTVTIAAGHVTAYGATSRRGGLSGIFADPTAAERAGLPAVIVPGPLRMTLVLHALLDWAGPAVTPVTYRVVHRRLVHPGSTLTLRGSVQRSDPSGEIELEVAALDAHGDPALMGNLVLKRRTKDSA